MALDEVNRLRATFPDLAEAAKFLETKALAPPVDTWSRFHAVSALCSAGRADDAALLGDLAVPSNGEPREWESANLAEVARLIETLTMEGLAAAQNQARSKWTEPGDFFSFRLSCTSSASNSDGA